MSFLESQLEFWQRHADEETFFHAYNRWWETLGPIFIVCGILYFPLWLGLQALMTKLDAKPWNLRVVKIVHNGLMFLYSLISGIYCLILAFEYWENFHQSSCGREYASHPYSIVIMLFAYSKLLELPETFYMVLERKNVIFLHYFHHIVTYTYALHGLNQHNPGALWFSVLNLWVHAVMYLYYTLFSITGKRASWAILITVFQIVQMFIGFTVCVLYAFSCPRDEHWSSLSAWFGMLMYFAYIILFVRFFVLRYVLKRSKAPSKAAKDGKKKQ